jgi:hypothetical protein
MAIFSNEEEACNFVLEKFIGKTLNSIKPGIHP